MIKSQADNFPVNNTVLLMLTSVQILASGPQFVVEGL